MTISVTVSHIYISHGTKYHVLFGIFTFFVALHEKLTQLTEKMNLNEKGLSKYKLVLTVLNSCSVFLIQIKDFEEEVKEFCRRSYFGAAYSIWKYEYNLSFYLLIKQTFTATKTAMYTETAKSKNLIYYNDNDCFILTSTRKFMFRFILWHWLIRW